MRSLIKSLRSKLLFAILLIVALIAAWLFWNRPVRSDMAQFVPADCLAFVEANDLTEITGGIQRTEAWKTLAGPLGAKSDLVPNRWMLRFARWTGIGPAEAVVVSRSQFAVVFMGAKTKEAETTLTNKPLVALIVETHTSESRMGPVIEKRLEEFARRKYREPVVVRKQVDGVNLVEWSPADNSSQLVVALIGSAAVVGNDEASVLHCVEARRGKVPSLGGNQQLSEARQKLAPGDPSVFGYVSKAGVKPILQAWILRRADSAADAATVARIFADTFGNLIQDLAWTVRFTDGGVEDRCFLTLAEGAAEKLRGSVVPQARGFSSNLTFVPADAHSFSTYNFRDVDGFWRDLNTVISARADIIGAIAARPLLRGLFKPYGIEDPDAFVRSIGTSLQTIRADENSASVLVADILDRQSLKRLVQQRFGASAKTETSGDAELLLSNSDNWAAGFTDKNFLIGPADAVRRCLQSQQQSQSITNTAPFRKSQALIDVSLPFSLVTFSDDRNSAISFVELFSEQQRSSFSTNAAAIKEGSQSLPYAVSVTMLKDNGFEWTSRSAFGLLGSLLIAFAPETSP